MNIVHTKLDIPTQDGWLLAADVFAPTGAAVKAVLILNSATGVAREFYARFATYAAKAGFATVTYDYRGTGGSLRGPIRACAARLRHWGEYDFPAVIHWAESTYPGLPLLGIGHSVGGQLFGLTAEIRKLAGLVGIGAQSGYWRLSDRPVRRWVVWHVTMPALSMLCGHLPGWAGIGMSLPKQVALEWARWGRSKEFFVDDNGQPLRTHFADITAPVLWFRIEHDVFASPVAVEWLAQRFTKTNPERRQFLDARFGQGRIGHFRIFTPKYVEAWDEILGWAEHHVLSRDLAVA